MTFNPNPTILPAARRSPADGAAAMAIAQLRAAGIELWVEGKAVRWRSSAGYPDADLLELAAHHRNGIRRLLRDVGACGACRRPTSDAGAFLVMTSALPSDGGEWRLCARCATTGTPPGLEGEVIA